ncbi:MAG: protein kinase [Myxococcales bacterium]|nr:protein kinase [Myxococcales bacterium]
MYPQLFGKYVLEREIAAGGMAKVLVATLRGAVGFEKRLVVKQIRPELASDEAFVRRFVEEAKTAVELGHPNIVPVYELGVEQGVYYIAMEFCEGVTLSEVLNETGTLSPEEGAYLGIEICRALDYAHRRASIVHRDVTPRNVMLDEEGAVRIIDFGIAAPVTLPDAGVQRSELFGTPGHMAPEQIAGDALTPATDVFAVGALLIEAWTGQPPFRRRTAADCLKALGDVPPRVGELVPELEPLSDLMQAAIAPKPADRPQSAELLARPLREFVKTADLGDVSRRIGTRVRRVRRKLLASSPWLLGVAEAEPQPLENVLVTRRAPSIGDTQTFAVRNDLVEWTRKLPSVPPPPDDAVVEPAPASEAMSTRPIASAVQEEPPPATASAERRPEPRRAARPLVTLAVVGAVAAAVWWGARASVPANQPNSPLAGPSASISAVAPPLAPSVPPSAPPSTSVTPDRPPVRPSAHAPTTASGAVDPSVRVSLTLSAEPPSSVSVGGKSYGTTPVSGAQLAPGTYFVSFENSTLGLRTGAQVTLTAGAKRSVHADFTGPSPRVIVR